MIQLSEHLKSLYNATNIVSDALHEEKVSIKTRSKSLFRFLLLRPTKISILLIQLILKDCPPKSLNSKRAGLLLFRAENSGILHCNNARTYAIKSESAQTCLFGKVITPIRDSEQATLMHPPLCTGVKAFCKRIFALYSTNFNMCQCRQWVTTSTSRKRSTIRGKGPSSTVQVKLSRLLDVASRYPNCPHLEVFFRGSACFVNRYISPCVN